MKYGHTLQWGILPVVMAAAISLVVHGEDFPSRVKQPVNDAVTIRQETQAASDAWHHERQALLIEYQALEEEIQRLSTEVTALEEKISYENKRMATLRGQQAAMVQISGELVPYLDTVSHQLKAAVGRDLPFHSPERSLRLEKLEKTLRDPAAPLDEKFGKTIETLFIEAEYGHTIELYTEKIRVGEQEITAEILRLGRLSLFCQSPDRKISGVYDPLTRQWKPLAASYSPDIQTAMEIGAKRRAAAMLKLPLGRLEVP